MCRFKNESGVCYLSKKVCQVPDAEIQTCRYYARQFPRDPAVLIQRVQATLDGKLARRNLFGDRVDIDVARIVDPTKSVYDNVAEVLAMLPTFKFLVKTRRPLDARVVLETRGSILSRVSQNMYDQHVVELVERNPETNEILGFRDGRKYLWRTRGPVDPFLQALRKKKKPDLWFAAGVLDERVI